MRIWDESFVLFSWIRHPGIVSLFNSSPSCAQVRQWLVGCCAAPKILNLQKRAVVNDRRQSFIAARSFVFASCWLSQIRPQSRRIGAGPLESLRTPAVVRFGKPPLQWSCPFWCTAYLMTLWPTCTGSSNWSSGCCLVRVVERWPPRPNLSAVYCSVRPCCSGGPAVWPWDVPENQVAETRTACPGPTFGACTMGLWPPKGCALAALSSPRPYNLLRPRRMRKSRRSCYDRPSFCLPPASQPRPSALKLFPLLIPSPPSSPPLPIFPATELNSRGRKFDVAI